MIYLVVRGSIKIVAVGTTSLPKIFWPTFPNQRGECVEIILKFAERYSNIPASHPHLSINIVVEWKKGASIYKILYKEMELGLHYNRDRLSDNSLRRCIYES